jgi:hypothetical protein
MINTGIKKKKIGKENKVAENHVYKNRLIIHK